MHSEFLAGNDSFTFDSTFLPLAPFQNCSNRVFGALPFFLNSTNLQLKCVPNSSNFRFQFTVMSYLPFLVLAALCAVGFGAPPPAEVKYDVVHGKLLHFNSVMSIIFSVPSTYALQNRPPRIIRIQHARRPLVL
jgi:hypothetical protein